MASHTDPKDNQILKLEKEIARLKKSLKEQRYGLVWLDVPEAFEDDVENKLPILKEVPELAIKNNDGKLTHILIEGDNYHALTCLNYTHKGKIDIIYIDPPYNTGSDGFRYKDKRIIDKFPDGTEVPKDHPFRHSYWLSFMKKRLELAKTLLKDTGAIFISIDDNEQAQLKLLCDEIFYQDNFVGQVVVYKGTSTGQDAQRFSSSFDYLLLYKKGVFELGDIPLSDKDKARFNKKDKKGYYAILQLRKTGKGDKYEDRPNLYYSIKAPSGKRIYPIGPTGYKSRWRMAKESYLKLEANGMIEWVKRNGNWAPYVKYYVESRGKRPSNLWVDIEGNKKASIELKDIFHKLVFENPKPTDLIKRILQLVGNKSSIVLDFFAGSGTTAHAVLELNKEDDGNRQFILCTNNENKICTDVCYPRIKKIIKGYKNQRGEKIKGLDNFLKYYRTAFIGKNNILNATDEDKVELAHNAGELLAIAENTLELVRQNKYYQLFEDTNKEKFTAVYFREELNKFEDFTKMVEKLKRKTTVYVFSWGNEEFSDDLSYLKDVTVKTIPQPILEIYKNIYNL
jgi:adenine-specific DNA-methyltransferase